MFDLSCITLAFNTADAAANAFDTLTAEMVQWHESGLYPERADVIKAIIASGRAESSAKVYASRMLAWAKAGKTPKTINEMVNDGPKATGKGGRPKGQGAGKTTATETPKPTETPKTTETPSQPKEWALYIEGMRAAVPGFKHWKSEDIVAFQESSTMMLALIKRNQA